MRSSLCGFLGCPAGPRSELWFAQIFVKGGWQWEGLRGGRTACWASGLLSCRIRSGPTQLPVFFPLRQAPEAQLVLDFLLGAAPGVFALKPGSG